MARQAQTPGGAYVVETGLRQAQIPGGAYYIDTTSSNTTTTQTIHGVSRIQKTVSVTETGISRIGISTSRTETGISRISATTTRTISGVSNIAVTGTTSQTETGKARITKTVTQTESGTSRIGVTATRTEQGVSRIGIVTTRIESGVSRITANTTRTESGQSRITANTTRTEPGVARISKTVTTTESGQSRISTSATRTETGQSRITSNVARTETGVATITATTTRTIGGTARISGGGAVTKPLGYHSVEVGSGISQTVDAFGNMLEIEHVTTAPTDPPENGEGVVFRVSGGVTTVYVWDGSNWVANGGGSGGAVDSVNGQTGVVVLDTGDIADTTDKRYVTDADLVTLGNTYNTNTGDQLMYGTIAVAGQGDLDPTGTGDTLTVVAGNNMEVLTDPMTNELTFNNTATQADSFDVVVDGAGTAITTGSKGTKYIPWDCTITGWDIRGDVSGSCVFDVKRSGTSLAGSEKPTLSSATSNSDLALSTWTTSLSAGDVIEFVVDSAATLTRATVTILVTKV